MFEVFVFICSGCAVYAAYKIATGDWLPDLVESGVDTNATIPTLPTGSARQCRDESSTVATSLPREVVQRYHTSIVQN